MLALCGSTVVKIETLVTIFSAAYINVMSYLTTLDVINIFHRPDYIPQPVKSVRKGLMNESDRTLWLTYLSSIFAP